MSRFDSDMDWNDEPWNRPEPCASRDCDNACDVPSMSAFCYECRTAQLIAQAEANEQHRREAARERKTA